MLKENCVACDIIAGKVTPPGGIIYENEYWMVDHTVNLMLPGFLIIKPKRHCEQLAELSLQEMESLAPILHYTCRALSHVMSPAKVYVCSFGEVVKHIHFWVIPRLPDMPAHGLEVLEIMVKEKRWACSEEEAAEIARRVREEYRQLLKE